MVAGDGCGWEDQAQSMSGRDVEVLVEELRKLAHQHIDAQEEYGLELEYQEIATALQSPSRGSSTYGIISKPLVGLR